MSIIERDYMKKEDEPKKLPELIVLPEVKAPQVTWVRNAMVFLITLIITMVTLRLLR